MANLPLRCHCGEVKGTATNISASTGNRVVCCCSDCQAFAVNLDRDAHTLDPFGGTDLFQMALSQLSIEQGLDKLKCMRLTQKGMLRWYTSCCNTPIGNTVNAKVPFVGVIHTFMDVSDRYSRLGPVRAYIQTQYAKGVPDYPKHSAKFPLSMTLRIIGKILLWKLQGKHKPNVFLRTTACLSSNQS